MSATQITLGKFMLTGLRDGFFYLDGGAVFGVVPKVLWEKKYPADQENRIKLGLNSLLIETGEKKILIDTGVGPDINRKLAAFYGIDKSGLLPAELAKLGYKTGDIDYVINTHLHFDHCGGNTRKQADGEYKPVFENARYIVQQIEWDNAIAPVSRDRPSYLSQYFVPLRDSGQLTLVSGTAEIFPGIEVMPAPGHTAGHLCIKISSEREVVIFLGDMVPTSAHVGMPYVMSYDLYPVDTVKSKELYYEKIVTRNWLVAFNHDPDHFFGRITEQAGKFVFQSL